MHETTLADSGPEGVATARNFLRTAHAPLANAAWAWAAAYGWRAVPFSQMHDYVSAQTYALRSSALAAGASAGCYSTTIGSVVAAGYAWDGVTPANRFCV